MTKQAEVAAATNVEKSVEFTPATVENVTPVTTNENLDLAKLLKDSSFENLKKSELAYSLNSEYISLKVPGETFRGVFIGFGECTVNDKSTGEQRILPAVRFLQNGKTYIHAGANLVSTIHRACLVIGTKVLITYKEDDGNVKIFDVDVLI